ncbi:MAG: outer membrane lipoprotein carrier protein LolA [Gammaproteobacteria bacterium]|nr:MAG: outer membrane lipoprotein carrier protein LolA [Gammaproteobacteria bacterium]
MKIKNRLNHFVFLILLALSFGAFAEEPLVLQLKQFLKSTKNLEAAFEQKVDDGRGDFEVSSGRFYLQKPDRFRWDYLEPYQQEIVSDGKKIWYFDADLEQVTVKPYKAMQGSALVVLLGRGAELEEQFNIEVISRLSDDQKIKLTPKESGVGIEWILIGMTEGLLSSLSLKDPFGQTTYIKFKSVKQNGEIAPSLFTFVVPDGADLLESE